MYSQLESNDFHCNNINRDHTVKVWDLTTKTCVASLLHSCPVYSVAATVVDGAPIVFTGGGDEVIKV